MQQRSNSAAGDRAVAGISSVAKGRGKLGVVTVQFFLARVTSNTNHANLPELSSEATVSVTAS